MDPRNRLVAAELERRWNAKPDTVKALESRLETLDEHCRPLTEREERAIPSPGESFATAWDAS